MINGSSQCQLIESSTLIIDYEWLKWVLMVEEEETEAGPLKGTKWKQLYCLLCRLSVRDTRPTPRVTKAFVHFVSHFSFYFSFRLVCYNVCYLITCFLISLPSLSVPPPPVIIIFLHILYLAVISFYLIIIWPVPFSCCSIKRWIIAPLFNGLPPPNISLYSFLFCY